MAEYRLPLDAAQRGSGPYVWRFRTIHRLTHFLAIISFYTLAMTGIPLRFTCAPWSVPLVELFGGVQRAGQIHRIAAIVNISFVLLHVGYLIFRFVRGPRRAQMLWGPDSLVPQPRDLIDFFRQWRWFFGRGERPRFGRYSYLEKLDYWGEVWGFFVIGGSGLLLWFSEDFGAVLPGWGFNVATVFHDYEAMIAIVFLFVVHFFNVHLRPDKFPLDAVMFTGRATADYVAEEHPLQVERWPQGEGRPQPPSAELASAPGRPATIVAAVFGYLALAIGIAIIGMVTWALSC